MKIDPYKHKERYLNWKMKVESGIPEISRENSDIIKQYIFDWKEGLMPLLLASKGLEDITG